MGWIRKAVLGRWLARWLLRGGPWSVAAKLALVAVYGAWQWRKEADRVEERRAAREIPADYEVVDEDREEPVPRAGQIPPAEEQGRAPTGTNAGPGTGSIRTDR